MGHGLAVEIRKKSWLDARLADTLREHNVALALGFGADNRKAIALTPGRHMMHKLSDTVKLGQQEIGSGWSARVFPARLIRSAFGLKASSRVAVKLFRPQILRTRTSTSGKESHESLNGEEGT